MQNITISNSIVSRGLKRKRWEGLCNLWWYEAVLWTVNRNCLILITTSFILFCLWSLVNWLIVELSEQSVWGSRDLQTSFSQSQTAPRVTSVSSCVTFLWVWSLTSEKRNAPSGEKIYISLLQSAISLYISRRDYPHRSSTQRTLFYAIQWAPVCHFLEKMECWNFGSSPQCIAACFLQPGEQPDSQTTSVLKNCDSILTPSLQLQSTLKNRIHISDTFHKFFTSALMINSSQE